MTGAAASPPRGAIAVDPGRDEFCALAVDHAVVPVVREVLADLLTPLGVYDRVRDRPGTTFLLESVEQGERWGRWSFVGLDPVVEVTARGRDVSVSADLGPEVAAAVAEGDPLVVVEALLASLDAPTWEGLPPLFAGTVGYVGYDVVRHIEAVPDSTDDDLGLDDLRMVVPGALVAFDHLRQRLSLIIAVVVGDDPGAQYDEAVARTDALLDDLARPLDAPLAAPPAAAAVDDARANMAPADYMRAVEAAKEHIRAGDVFQCVPSQRFSLDTDVDPLAVYRVLRVINPSPYMYTFDFGDLQIVGSSPEALVTLSGGEASIWPIAGSRPRGADDSTDAALEAELLADDKERAEHVMLVDLARNDLGRVSALGTVVVTELMEVVRYSHIMHIVSKVRGRVRDGLGPIDVLRATFPAGTLSGAPKVRAMQIIDDLEPTRRGPYGGGIGYIGLGGDMDLCIAIRTLLFTGGTAHVQAGAGVVADSVPETEHAETRAKAMALLAAVRAAEAMTRDELR